MSRGEDFTFEIKQHIGVLGVYSTGWKKELNLIEWNGNNAKFDIRDWDPRHEHMSRGITMHEEEIKALVGLMCTYFKNESNASD